MTHLLIKFHDNYADEFDLDGYWVTTQERFDELIESARAWWEANPGSEYEHGFGTNECLQWSNLNQFKACFTSIREISDAELELIKNLFDLKKSYSFGDDYELGYVAVPDFEIY